VSGPESLESLVKHARWTRDALDRAAGEQPASPPEGETAAQAFTRRMREQAEAERRDAELERRVMFENPGVPPRDVLDDPLRAHARVERVRRRRPRRRGTIP
jgi:hypothetical protein